MSLVARVVGVAETAEGWLKLKVAVVGRDGAAGRPSRDSGINSPLQN